MKGGLLYGKAQEISIRQENVRLSIKQGGPRGPRHIGSLDWRGLSQRLDRRNWSVDQGSQRQGKAGNTLSFQSFWQGIRRWFSGESWYGIRESQRRAPQPRELGKVVRLLIQDTESDHLALKRRKAAQQSALEEQIAAMKETDAQIQIKEQRLAQLRGLLGDSPDQAASTDKPDDE